MVQIRENRHKHSTRHAVTTVSLRLRLPADAATIGAMIVKVGRRKEAAP